MLTTGQWGELLSLCPTWYDKVGLVSSLIAAPAFLDYDYVADPGDIDYSGSFPYQGRGLPAALGAW